VLEGMSKTKQGKQRRNFMLAAVGGVTDAPMLPSHAVVRKRQHGPGVGDPGGLKNGDLV
jgi:hypothetical protein